MSRMVMCVKLKKEAEGLDRPTYPGDLGKRVFENVSKEGWQLWVRHQTMLINEYRLSPVDPEGAQVHRRADGKILLRRWRRDAAGFQTTVKKT